MGEQPETFHTGKLIETTLEEFGDQSRVKLSYQNFTDDLQINIPPRTFKRTLKELLLNASDASGGKDIIELHCSNDKNFLYFAVTDKGKGMDAQTLAKARNPFFTTKETGKGMGLGLYLARTMAQQFGGGIDLASEKGKGTRATLRLSRKKVTPAAQP